jgi:hypothetical protein
MLRSLMIGAVSAAVLTMATTVFAQQAKYGTAAEAKAMMEKAVAAVKADKAKAIEMFNKGEGGFKDRDLQPFCFNISDGKIVAATVPSALNTDVRALKDKTGKAFGEEVYKAAQQLPTRGLARLAIIKPAAKLIGSIPSGQAR